MQSNWAGKHSDALREYLAKDMSFAEIADAINAKFKTAYSRSAAIGRAKRMGIASPDRAKDLPRHWPAAPKAPPSQPRKLRERHAPELIRPMPMFEHKLRCVEIDPRQYRFGAVRRHCLTSACGGGMKRRATRDHAEAAAASPPPRAHLRSEIQFQPSTEAIQRATGKA